MKESQLLILKEIEKARKISLKELAKRVQRSKSFVSKVCKSLIKLNLIGFEKNKKIYYFLSKNPKVLLILKIIETYPKLLTGKREILLKELLEERDIVSLQSRTGLSLKQLLTYLHEFKSSGIIVEKNKKYSINPEKKIVRQLAELIKLEEEEGVVWRDHEELRVSEEEGEGTLTAFSAFKDFGLPVFTPKHYYILPERKLTREEVFVHSLLVSNSFHEKLLCSIFYLKNKDSLDMEKVFRLLNRYRISTKFFDLLKFIKDNEKEVREKAKEYNVKVVKTSKDKILDLFRILDGKLSFPIKIFLIGGANMLLRGLKISTKDIDILIEGKYYEEFKKALLSLGFFQRGNIFEKDDYRIDLFKDRVLHGFYLSKIMKNNAELFWKGRRLEVWLLRKEYVFLFKSISGREIDLDDCRILAERGLNWDLILREALNQQEKIKEKIILLPLLDVLDELDSRFNIHSPISKKLDRIVSRLLILNSLKRRRTVKELVALLEKPESTIRKILDELKKEGKVERKREKRGYSWKLKFK